MCGIVGELSDRPIDEVAFVRRRNTLGARGPDGCGVHRSADGRVMLGHMRLSIIDLSDAGAQPMSNEDGTVWITFNGEVYNFQDLRRELEPRGHRFKSHSDTEVLVHAYEEWGLECVRRFRGIFAFGIWDARARRMFLARDHVGVKPLYYSCGPRGLRFASELRALTGPDEPVPPLNMRALSDYLAYGYVPYDQAIFAGCAKLPPGHTLTFDGTSAQVRAFWSLTYAPDITDEIEAREQVEAAVEDAVRVQAVSDVPVGTFLSGGVDSSAVTAILSDNGRRVLDTFTIGFNEEGSDERPYARLAAERFHARQHVSVLTPERFRELIPAFVENYDEPFFDTSGVPTYAVSRLARDTGCKVVQTGDGGDEVFAGYLWYDRLSTAFRTPDTGRSLLSRLIRRRPAARDFSRRDFLDAYFGLVGYMDWPEQERLFTPAAAEHARHDCHWLLDRFLPDGCPLVTSAQMVDVRTYLVDDILVKVDRASMACGLEARVPLLDHRLLEMAFRIDGRLVYRNGERKHLFKEAIRRWVPPEILTARKKGFSIPGAAWTAGWLREYALGQVSDGVLVARGIFDRTQALLLLRDGPNNRVRLLLAAELWARRWLERQQIDPPRGRAEHV